MLFREATSTSFRHSFITNSIALFWEAVIFSYLPFLSSAKQFASYCLNTKLPEGSGFAAPPRRRCTVAKLLWLCSERLYKFGAPAHKHNNHSSIPIPTLKCFSSAIPFPFFSLHKLYANHRDVSFQKLFILVPLQLLRTFLFLLIRI